LGEVGLFVNDLAYQSGAISANFTAFSTLSKLVESLNLKLSTDRVAH